MRILSASIVFLTLLASVDAQITVSSLADSGPGTLRQAIIDANAQAGCDTIVMSPGLSGTINLSSTLPTITDELGILGDSDGDPATIDIEISGGNACRIMAANGAPWGLADLTLRDGNAGPQAGGGAIDFNSSHFTHFDATNVRFVNNRSGNGGAVNIHGIGARMTFSDCEFHQNSIVSGTTLLGEGGAIAINSSLNGMRSTTVSTTLCTFTENSSSGPGGALSLRGVTSYNTISHCLFEKNQCTSGGGGAFMIYDSNSAASADRPFNNVVRSVFRDNCAPVGGAGQITIIGSATYVARVHGSTFAANKALTDAAALDVLTGSGPGQVESLELSSCTFSGQSAGTAGGDSCFAGTARIRNTNVDMDSCTIAGNSATGANLQGLGLVGGFDISDGDLTLRNTIFDRNRGVATGTQDAEALRHRGSGAFTDADHNLVNDTVDLQLGALNGANNIIGTSPFLGPLVPSPFTIGRSFAQEPMPVHYPGPGSTALDAGASGQLDDQIGTFRPGGGDDDIGAIEGSLAIPDIALSRRGSAIPDGGMDSLGDRVIGSTRTLIYSVDNSLGTDSLFLGSLNITNHVNVTSIDLVGGLPPAIPVGGSGTLVFRFQVLAVGAFGFDVDIFSAAGDGTYDIAVAGQGILPTLGVAGVNDLTINGQGSGTRSCTPLSFVSPIPSLSLRVSSSAPGLPVAILFRRSACSLQSMVISTCNQTQFDLVYTPNITQVMGVTGADGSFTTSYPVGTVPFDVTFSTQALIAHPCGPLFTQAFDVTIR